LKFWIKYIALGLVLALGHLLLISDSAASLELRRWLVDRLVLSVVPELKEQTSEPAVTTSYADAIEKSAPAVVSIKTVSKGTAYKNPNPTSLEDRYLINVGLNVGSGVIIDARGYVITSYHVVRDAESIIVQLSDGRQKIATVIGYDLITDLALLFIDLDNLPTPRINAKRESRVGDLVFAIGNPYGQFQQTVTMGIISATRSFVSGVPYFQMDAAIHPGNSGGALINAHGEIIGITASQLAAPQDQAAQTGISFAIPFSVAQDIADDLLDDGKIQRGWLGFSASPLNERGYQIYAPEGIKFGEGFGITSLDENGPAQLAGLQVHDFVTHINGELITDFRQVYRIIGAARPKDVLTFKVYRNKKPLTIDVVVGELPHLLETSPTN
jgi:serine protease DegS